MWSENKILSVIGDVYYQYKAIEAWRSIKTDEHIRACEDALLENVARKRPFWNIHVALAFLAEKLNPRSYLEVGVRTCGSLVQVLHHADVKEVVALDLWDGSYAELPNTLEFAVQQVRDYVDRAGRAIEIELTKGNSHKELRRLDDYGRRFDLITVDGDHTEKGAWLDLQDAAGLLAERGAIVFDDILHPMHLYLAALVDKFRRQYPDFDVLMNSKQDVGCAIFLRDIDVAELLSPGPCKSCTARRDSLSGRGGSVNPSKTPVRRSAVSHRGLKVAEDYVQNGVKVDTESSFGQQIKKLFAQITPHKIIETGTYLGTGTTTIIANALKDLGINDAVFCTIEVNPDYHAKARKYFLENNVEVHAINGLSVPRSMLPSRQDITRTTVTDVQYDDIFVDHREQNRVDLYYSETDFPNVPDNRLYKVLEVFDFKPDFVLLDSGGHVGSVEFDYLIDNLKGQCYIALDDIYHVKHHQDLRKMQQDDRFEIVVHSDEKFGYCIARFDPAEQSARLGNGITVRRRDNYRKVLIVRPDSIGDFVLFAGTLKYFKEFYRDAEIHILIQQHIAELAESCPYIDHVIKLERKKFTDDKSYAEELIADLKKKEYDVAIHPVYSRDQVGDYLTLESGAEKKIALNGDCSNLSEPLKLKNDAKYTRLIPAESVPMLETKRNEELIRSFGVEPSEPCMPEVWLESTDYAAADKLLDELNVKHPIIVSPFGQYEIRHWPEYNWAKLLSSYKDHPVLICGARSNHTEAERIIKLSGHRRMYNLCGKTTLRQLAALLTRARLCVGVESAAAHIAAAVGCPHVIIVGGGHFGRFAPYSPLTTLVYLPAKCFNCNWLCPRKFRQSYCITQIRVETVDMAVKIALKRPKNECVEPVLIAEPVNRDFRSSQPLEIQIDEIVDVDLNEIEPEKYLITAVVSTYNAERHIEGCLQNLEDQTIADRLEIIVVDSNSPQNEGDIVKRFQQRYENIKYIRTEKREPIYKAWNRAIRVASGKYITNANTDDRLKNNALEYMVKALEQNPHVALVYCDQDWVDDVNGAVVKEYLTPEFSRLRLLAGDCYMSSNPVWRKQLHDEFGYFEEDVFCVSGDWEFWLRVSQKHDYMRIKEKFGIRCFAPDCYSRANFESRTGIAHLDIALICKAYHYAAQTGIFIDARAISQNPVFYKWPETQLLLEKTRAKFEDRTIAPADYVAETHAFVASDTAKLSIVIAAGSENSSLLRTLYALNEQTEKDFEVIVISSGSVRMKPARIAKKLGYDLLWIDLSKDLGPSFAKNVALKYARGEYLAFLGQGDIPEGDFVGNICRHFQQYPAIYALRGRILPSEIGSAAFVPDGYDLGDGVIRTTRLPRNNCAFRKDVLTEAGGFDEDLFLREFQELAYRAFISQDRNIDGILYFSDVVVRRDLSTTLRQSLQYSIDDQVVQLTLANKWPSPELSHFVNFVRDCGPADEEKSKSDCEWMTAVGLALEEKYPEIALMWAQRVLNVKPSEPVVNYLAGAALFRLGRLDEAQLALEDALSYLRTGIDLELAGSSGKPSGNVVTYIRFYASCCTKLADCYIKRREFGKLKEIYNHMLNHRHLALSEQYRAQIQAVLTKIGNVESGLTPVPYISAGQTRPQVLPQSISTKPAPEPLVAATAERRPLRDCGSSPYLVTAIVSTYNAERFIRGCLEDLENQTIADKLEIIVVNSNSQQNEEQIVREFQRKYGNIVYIKTDKRENLYTAWNRAVKIARGQFLTNANADDRHRGDALEILANTLLENPDIALVYSDQIITDTPNPTFENHHAVQMAKRPEYSHNRLLFGCCVGSQPMWRKKLHDELGYFDDALDSAADWEFWLRVSGKYPFKRVPEFLGVYFHNAQGLEHGRKIHSLYERYLVGKRYGNPYISIIPVYTTKDNSLVSVVMPAHNAREYIAEAIESVLIQDYRNFELVIVDDGSIDNTADIIAGFKDEKIRYFRQDNKGASSARNLAIRKAKGKFIIPLDADDMMVPNAVAEHLKVFEQNPDVDLVYSDVLLIDAKSRPIKVMRKPEYNDRNLLVRDLFSCGHPIVPFRLGIRRDVFDKIGFYDETLLIAEDYDMMRRFVKQGLKMRHISEALHWRRMTDNSLSRQFSGEKAASHFEVIRRFTETFTFGELFGDVDWDATPVKQRQLLAKCRVAVVYLGIGNEYIKTGAADYGRMAFDLACEQLRECLEIEPENPQVRQLLEKCESIRAGHFAAGIAATSQAWPQGSTRKSGPLCIQPAKQNRFTLDNSLVRG